MSTYPEVELQPQAESKIEPEDPLSTQQESTVLLPEAMSIDDGIATVHRLMMQKDFRSLVHFLLSHHNLPIEEVRKAERWMLRRELFIPELTIAADWHDSGALLETIHYCKRSPMCIKDPAIGAALMDPSLEESATFIRNLHYADHKIAALIALARKKYSLQILRYSQTEQAPVVLNYNL